MKKHKLLKHAYDNYPKGTIFLWPYDTIKNKVTSSGIFEFTNSGSIYDKNDTSKAVFNGDEWAEIITEEKPKSINLYHGMKCIVKEKVSKSHEIEIYDADNLVTVLSPSDIEDITQALNQLK